MNVRWRGKEMSVFLFGFVVGLLAALLSHTALAVLMSDPHAVDPRLFGG